MPYEFCSTFYLMHSLIWMMQKTGEARYGDMFEQRCSMPRKALDSPTVKR